MTRQTLRFNKVVPGFLLGGLLLGFIALFAGTLKHHLAAESWWTATWVSAVDVAIIFGIIKALRSLYRRPDTPDCRPIYLASAVLVAFYSGISTLGYFFPREMTIASEKATSAVLWMLSPFGRDYDRMIKLRDDIDNIAMDQRAHESRSDGQPASH